MEVPNSLTSYLLEHRYLWGPIPEFVTTACIPFGNAAYIQKLASPHIHEQRNTVQHGCFLPLFGLVHHGYIMSLISILFPMPTLTVPKSHPPSAAEDDATQTSDSCCTRLQAKGIHLSVVAVGESWDPWLQSHQVSFDCIGGNVLQHSKKTTRSPVESTAEHFRRGFFLFDSRLKEVIP